MRKLLVPLIVLALLFACISSTWAISGRVVDDLGKPVPKAVVQIITEATGRPEVKMADDHGALTYTHTYRTHRMNYSIKVLDRDGKPMAKAQVTWPALADRTVKSAQTGPNGAFQLKPPTVRESGDFNGFRVRTASGEPAPRATLEVTFTPGRPAESVVMDDNGEMRYGQPSSSTTQVTVIADGFAYRSARVEGGEPITVTLRREAKTTGRIVGEDGKPVAGSTVLISSLYFDDGNGRYEDMSADGGRSHGPHIVTDKNGRFALHHLPPASEYRYGNISLEVTKPGLATIHIGSGLQDLSKKLTITQPRECRISGVLYLPGKSATAPVGTDLYAMVTGKNTESAHAAIGAGGKFEFTKLPPGKASVFLTPGYDTGAGNYKAPREWTLRKKDFVLAPASKQQIELEAIPGVMISGILKDKDSGKPLPKASLQVTSDAIPPNMGWTNAFTDDKGEFRFRVPSGKVKIAVESVIRDQRSAYIDPGQQPTMDITAEDGKDQAGLVFEMVLADAGHEYDEYISGTVPADFELKPGEYNLTWDPNLKSGADIWTDPPHADDKAKSHMTKLPTFKSSKPRFYAFPLDGADFDGYILVAIDESKGTGKGFDTGYVDANRNGDMTDDQPVSWKMKDYDQHSPWIATTCRQGPAGPSQTTNPAFIRLALYGTNGEIIGIDKKGAWVGQIETNKGKVPFASVDMNADGIYGEQPLAGPPPLVPRKLCDSVFVDSTGHGSVVVSSYSGSQQIDMQKACILGKRLYDIVVTPTGDKVTIAPYAGPTGRLKITSSKIAGADALVSSASLTGDAGNFRFDSVTDPITLPVGNYKLGSCQLQLKAKSGNTLQLYCEVKMSASVEAAKETPLTIAGDLNMAISPDQKEMRMKPGTSCGLHWVIKIGDKVTVSSLSAGQERPTVNFLNKAGKLIYSTKAGST